MATWRKRFTDLGAEIRNHPLLNVERFELGDPAPADALRAAEEAAGGTLPDGMREVYQEINGCRLEWRARDPKSFDTVEPPMGFIQLLEIGASTGTIFGSWDDEIWFSQDGDETFKGVKPVDFFINEACAALYPVPGDMKMHYHYLGEELHPTGYSFLQYLELLFKSRGYFYWQQALCVDKQLSQRTKEFRTIMPVLFPDFESEAFKPNTSQGEIES